jgi:hypothetical protein
LILLIVLLQGTILAVFPDEVDGKIELRIGEKFVRPIRGLLVLALITLNGAANATIVTWQMTGALRAPFGTRLS